MSFNVLPVNEQIDQSHLSNLEKYKVAGDIADSVLEQLLQLVKPGANIYHLCVLGDKMIDDKVNDVYKSKKSVAYGKGIAFPTSISVNNCIGYNSPISEDDIQLIDNGDIVKVELGVHIDGFPATIAKTIVAGDDNNKNEILIAAVQEASVSVIKMLSTGPNKTNVDVGDAISSVADKYGFSLLTVSTETQKVPGILSYQVSQNVLDGCNDDGEEYPHTLIMPKPNDSFDFQLRSIELLDNEVFAIDVVMATGNGKVLDGDTKTSIYKRNHDIQYNLKMKSSRQTINNFNDAYFPVNLRSFHDKKTRIGIFECQKHGMLESYHVTYVKEGDYVAQCKFTVAIKDGQPVLLTNKSIGLEKKKKKKNKKKDKKKKMGEVKECVEGA